MSKKGKKSKSRSKENKPQSAVKPVSVADEPETKKANDSVDDAKVIDRKGSKLIISGGSSSSQPKEKRAISIEPRSIKPKKSEQLELFLEPEEDEPPSHILRLESKYNPAKERVKVEKAKFEKLEAVADQAEKAEQKWDEEISTGWWIGIAGIGAVALVLAAIILKFTIGSEAKPETEEVFAQPPAIKENPYEGSPKKWFHDNMPFVEKRVFEILSEYNESKDITARSRLVRFPELYLKHAPSWERVFRPRAANDDHTLLNIDGDENMAFMVLSSRDTDFMPIKIYFVRQEEDLKLDWHASVAWSETPIHEIKKQLSQQKSQHEKALLDYQLAVHKAKQEQELYEQEKSKFETSKLKISNQNNEQDTKRATANTYAVRKGDTLSGIANRFKVNLATLMQANELKNSTIRIGQNLRLPVSPEKNKEVEISLSSPPEPPKPWQEIAQPKEPELLFSDPQMLRCLLTRRDEFYAGPYNEKQHSAFMLRSSDKLAYLWCYVPKNSALDEELRRLLDHGRFVVNLKKDYPVTVKIKKARKDALPSQFELVELIHSGWVAP